ncbi:ABC transporter ATP-binding protein [Tabrizicola sp.]|uniref:ABC transporter ATP-binding protein n=1 Tax=Tabrizicola sp. TaxID=2005166 RepID=UPI0027361517|nr:ABC transporter ATP-binding protein [Tabrizicola sp.]MDP3194999.1 ABC transporter ATP-binding protein [Tabrizicola sp.]
MTRLSLHGLRKTYPGTGQAAVHGIDLTVESGSLTALLGPSGCGKTTTMKLIAGLIAPDAGEVRLDASPITALPPERRGVTMVFQDPLLFPHQTIAQNIGFGLRMRGLPPARIAESVAAMLSRVRLDGLGDRRPAALSGGQQQRAALARALVLQPRVLLLDEPLSNLDPGLRDEMRQLIRSLQQETGITTIVVTHDQAEAVALADQIVLILEGRLAQQGPPDALYRRPAALAVARFFGGVNFLPGRSQGGLFHSAVGPLTLPPGAPEGDHVLTLRPEALRLGPGPNPRTARITSVTFLGTQTRVGLAVDGTALQALTTPDLASALVPGGEVTVSLPPEALWLLPPEATLSDPGQPIR